MADYVKFERNGLVLIYPSDKMIAYLIKMSDAVDYGENDVLELLAKAKIVYGIDEMGIEDFLANQMAEKKYRVAVGKVMKPERWEGFENFISLERSKIPEMTDNKKVDFKELNIIENVIWEQVLSRRLRTSEGENGRNILGDEIPYEVIKKDFPMGENTKISSDNEDLLVSSINGAVYLRNGKITVTPDYYIDGNVDYNTGNIVFVGNLEITGDIKEGFEVQVGGNILIHGTLEKANVECGGNLKIKRGVIGSPLTKIIVKKDCWAGFIENAKIECYGNIFVEKHVNHSLIKVGKKISVGQEDKKYGKIVGGKTIAGEIISANEIGNEYNTKTSVELALNPFLKRKIEKIYHNLKKLTKEKASMENQLKYINHNLIDGQNNNKDQTGRYEEMKEKFEKDIPRLEKKIAKLSEELQSREVEFTKGMKQKYRREILVNRKIYPGVYVMIRNIESKMTKDYDSVKIYEKDDEILMEKFDKME